MSSHNLIMDQNPQNSQGEPNLPGIAQNSSLPGSLVENIRLSGVGVNFQRRTRILRDNLITPLVDPQTTRNPQDVNLLGAAQNQSIPESGSLVGNIRLGGVNFQRRTAEGSRLLRENFNTVFQEIRPLVEQARTVNQNGISLSNLLNRSRTEASAIPATSSAPQSQESFVINLDETNSNPLTHQIDGNTHIHIHNHTGENYFNNLGQARAANNNNQDAVTAVEALRQVPPEARALLDILQKYVPFLLILLVKGLYDHRDGILNFMILLIIFGHSNSVVKREAAKQQRRSFTTLLFEVFGIVVCILLIGYVFNEDYFYTNLVFIPPYTQPLSVWDLIWLVGITDFILKLITILIKIVVIILPALIVPYPKKVNIITIRFFSKLLNVVFCSGEVVFTDRSYVAVISQYCSDSTLVVLFIGILSRC